MFCSAEREMKFPMYWKCAGVLIAIYLNHQFENLVHYQFKCNIEDTTIAVLIAI